MRKIIRALVILALAGSLGAFATGTAFASATPGQTHSHRLPGRDAYQQPQGRVNLPNGGGDEPPQDQHQIMARPDGGTDQPPQNAAA